MRAGAITLGLIFGFVKSVISTRTIPLYRFKVMNFALVLVRFLFFKKVLTSLISFDIIVSPIW